MRNDKKPFRVGLSSSGRFRAWTNRSHPKGGQLLLRISTLWMARAGMNKISTAQRKTPKGGQKERS